MKQYGRVERTLDLEIKRHVLALHIGSVLLTVTTCVKSSYLEYGSNNNCPMQLCGMS